jgi:Flp pilus assembly protein TadD
MAGTAKPSRQRPAAAHGRRHAPASAKPGAGGRPRRADAGRRGRLLLLLLAAAIVPLLVYWPTTGYGFLLDDTVLFQKSASLDDAGSIPRGFLTDVGALRKGSPTPISSYYRPVFLALSTLYHQAAGGRPFAWHLAAVVLAGLIGALACAWFLRLGFAPAVALLASIVFSLHPAHASSVAWASGLQELLAAFFVLLALLAALWRRDAERDTLPLAAAAAAYALALLCKEIAIALLPFAALWALHVRRTDPPAARRVWRLTALLAGVTVAYLAVRVAVLGGLALTPENAPRLGASLPAMPVALATYLRLLLWPAGFAFFRPERPNLAPFDPAVLAAVAVVAALAAAGAWAWRRNSPFFLAIAWFVVWLLPVLNLWALAPHYMVTDRYLFLASLALPWCIALAVRRRYAVAVLALAAVLCGALTVRYCAIFANERVFVAAMEKAEPTSPVIFAEKGRLLLQDGDLAAARGALERAVALDPLAPGPLLNLGDLARRQGDFDLAERRYRQALAVMPYASRPFKLLALDLARRGEHARALALIEEAVRRWPGDFEVQLLAALLRADAGERQQAEAAFAAAGRLRPGDAALAGGLDGALARLLPTLQPR